MDNQRAIQLLQAHIDAADMPLFSQAAAMGIRAIERVALLEAELAEARKEIEALRIKPWQEQIDGQAETISRLRYELAEARKDGERYRYVRDVGFKFADVSLSDDCNGRGVVYFRATFTVVEPANWPKYDEEEWRPSEIDAAIDAAHAAEGGKG